MTVRLATRVVMVALGLTVTANVAMAQSGPNIGDGSDPGYSATQQKLMTEPGYSIGTGSGREGTPAQNPAAGQRDGQAEPGRAGSSGVKDIR